MFRNCVAFFNISYSILFDNCIFALSSICFDIRICTKVGQVPCCDTLASQLFFLENLIPTTIV